MPKRAALPPRLVYSLLKALDLGKLKQAEVRPSKGQPPNKKDRETVMQYLDAAAQAKSAKQFETQIRGNSEVFLGFLITDVSVKYTDDGYTIVTIRLLSGGTIILAYPTED